MKLYTLIFLLFISIILFTSCKKEENVPTSPNPTKNTDVLVPLAVGNYWVYLTQSLDSTGNAWSQRYDTVFVQRDTLIEGERWYYLSDIFTGSGFRTNRQDGYWYRDGNWVTLYLPYPCQAGDSIVISNGGVINIPSIQDTVYCSAGRFICYRYCDGSYHTYKYAPNIGRIYCEQIYMTIYTHYKYVGDRQFLISYKIN